MMPDLLQTQRNTIRSGAWKKKRKRKEKEEKKLGTNSEAG
jgi:hypothetical protein